MLSGSTLASANGCVPPPIFHAAGASVPWGVFVCPALIILSAAVVNARDHRELTSQEAWTCGVAGLFSPSPAAPQPVVLKEKY
jgi:hypothetical protein